MARIKVTGYINTEDVDPGFLDLDHEMGVSNQGFETGLGGLRLTALEDVEYVLEDD